MDPHNGGNIIPEITREEHDHSLGAKRVNLVGTPTLYAVVNTSAAGIATVVVGNPTVYIGTPTLYAVVNTGSAGVQNSMVTVNAGPNQIGSVTVSNFVAPNLGSVTLNSSVSNIGFATVNVSGIAAGANYIGLATVVIGNSVSQPVAVQPPASGSLAVNVIGNVTLSNSQNFIGLVTVVQSSAARTITGNISISNIAAGVNFIGHATVRVASGAAFIGLTTTVNAAGTAFIGLVTVVQSSSARTITGNLTLSNSQNFIGLVTAVSLTAGTTKTLINLPIAFNASVSTIAVPATNLSIKVTNMLLSADATVVVRMKSGVTYLTGNASLGVSLNPNGGFVLTGSPDSPSWIGLPSGALVIEKNNTTTNIAGNVVYFAE